EGEEPMTATLRQPGVARATKFAVFGFALVFGVSVLIRAIAGDHPAVNGVTTEVVAAIAVPILFFWGLRRDRPPSPGWYRVALYSALGLAFAFGLVALIRFLMHEHPVIDGDAITIVSLIAVPLFFLVGMGTADYWFYWAAGRATRPEDHSGHGAYSWRDYF